MTLKYRGPTAASLLGIAISGVVLAGWLFDVEPMRALVPGMPSMIPMSAFSLLLISVSLLAGSRYLANPLRAAARPCLAVSLLASGVAMFFALLTLFDHAFGYETGIAGWILPERVAVAGNLLFAGKMTIQSSLVILLMATMVTRRLFRRPGRHEIVFQALPFLVIALCLLALVGFVHGITWGVPLKWIGLSIPSSIAYALLAVGVLALEPSTGFMGHWRSSRSDGLFIRWATTVSVVVPVVISTALRIGERKLLYPPAFSDALFAVVTIFVLFGLGVYLATAIRRLEDQRVDFEQRHARAALRESEESLQEANERLEFALEASRMGTWEVDLKNETAIWSQITEKIYGVTVGRLHHRPAEFFELIHEADRARVFEERKVAIESGGTMNSVFRAVRPDGQTRWIRIQGRVRVDDSGRPETLSGTVLDITEEKNRQDALESALRAAESASQLKTSFLANMSHEIRTPLGAILGFTDLLSDPSASAEDKARFLEIISRNGKTLSHLINDILDLSKVEAGHLNVEFIEFSLREAVDEVVHLLERDAQDGRIGLKVEYAPDYQDRVRSDPVRLKQILINLIGNAIKFTPAGGVTVRVSSGVSSVTVDIEDTGIGIDEKQRAKLFQPFSQADDSTTRRFGGTGLGLVLSRRLAALLGGSVELKSSVPGRGSVFSMTILNAVDEKTDRAGHVPAPAAGGKPAGRLTGVRVLLAEDQADNRKLISLLLKGEGAEVDLAKDGLECVEQAARKTYDVILMDIQMPVLDGYSATSRLRNSGFKKPIIALTAHAMSDVRDKCLEVGCNAHLTKPVNRVQLAKTIAELVS